MGIDGLGYHQEAWFGPEGVWTVRVVSRRWLERMDRALDEEWNGRLDAEARRARLVMVQCDRVLLGWGGLYGIAVLVTILSQGLGPALVVVFVMMNVPPVLVLRVYFRASRHMSGEVGRSYGVPADLTHLLDRRRGWAGLDASAAQLIAIDNDTPARPASGEWSARERRIARMWGHRLDATGVHALYARSRWFALAALDVVATSLVLAFVRGSSGLVVAAIGVAVFAVALWRMHRWKQVYRASACRMLGISPAAARRIPATGTIERFDAAVDRARHLIEPSAGVGS